MILDDLLGTRDDVFPDPARAFWWILRGRIASAGSGCEVASNGFAKNALDIGFAAGLGIRSERWIPGGHRDETWNHGFVDDSFEGVR